MADTNEGTTEGTEQAPDAGAQAPAAGTTQTPDEVTTLRSRNAGLDAKVTELLKTAKAAEERAASAEARALELAQGKANGDEELRAQLSAKDAELARVAKEAALARIEAKYPETFGVLGEAAANLSADQLAASEARFAGVPETRTPTPLGTGAARPPAGGSKAIEDMSVAELEALMGQQFSGSGFDPHRD